MYTKTPDLQVFKRFARIQGQLPNFFDRTI